MTGKGKQAVAAPGRGLSHYSMTVFTSSPGEELLSEESSSAFYQNVLNSVERTSNAERKGLWESSFGKMKNLHHRC